MKGKIFNAQEVQSIIAGNKTMFREVVKPQPRVDEKEIKCPYRAGQKIFCKEKFKERLEGIYYADDEIDFRKEYLKVSPYKPAQHMKQEQSHITLLIKEIRVERLADISRGDCMAEGCPFPNIAKETDPKGWFKELWNATHKKPEEKFGANPWVWVVSFEIINN